MAKKQPKFGIFPPNSARFRANHPNLICSLSAKFQRLQEINASIEGSRLVREDTLCADSMGEKERKKLRQKRTGKARHWNLLTDMEAKGAR